MAQAPTHRRDMGRTVEANGGDSGEPSLTLEVAQLALGKDAHAPASPVAAFVVQRVEGFVSARRLSPRDFSPSAQQSAVRRLRPNAARNTRRMTLWVTSHALRMWGLLLSVRRWYTVCELLACSCNLKGVYLTKQVSVKGGAPAPRHDAPETAENTAEITGAVRLPDEALVPVWVGMVRAHRLVVDQL